MRFWPDNKIAKMPTFHATKIYIFWLPTNKMKGVKLQGIKFTVLTVECNLSTVQT